MTQSGPRLDSAANTLFFLEFGQVELVQQLFFQFLIWNWGYFLYYREVFEVNIVLKYGMVNLKALERVEFSPHVLL